MRKSWTDERLDHFVESVERRFDEIDRRFGGVDRRFNEVDRRLDKIDGRLERLEDGVLTIQRAMVFGAIGMTTAMLAGFAALATLLATQT